MRYYPVGQPGCPGRNGTGEAHPPRSTHCSGAVPTAGGWKQPLTEPTPGCAATPGRVAPASFENGGANVLVLASYRYSSRFSSRRTWPVPLLPQKSLAIDPEQI